MKRFKRIAFFLLGSVFACSAPQRAVQNTKDDGIIEVVFLQLNDVYEISPLGDGLGGLARVATVRKNLLRENPNTFTVLAGDFISPSAAGQLKHEGARLRGRQMIETLNAIGVDWVVMGNHEFDYDLPDLQKRIDESNFAWIASNARLKVGEDTMRFFKNLPSGEKEFFCDYLIKNLRDSDGTSIRLGVFGVLISTGRKPYVEYQDPFRIAANEYIRLAHQTDVMVAMTHLGFEDDKKLAAQLQGIPLFIGGHDHEHQLHKVGRSVVAKADANAKTVYIHRLRLNKFGCKTELTSELKIIDDSIIPDSAAAAVVSKWENIISGALATSGFEANKEVVRLGTPVDARESAIRYRPMPVGDIITAAMVAAGKRQPQIALLNSGSIRIDDVLSGSITQYDVVRMLPFGGAVVEVEMRGDLLLKTLEAGEKNVGNGGYLQMAGVRRYGNSWEGGGNPINSEAWYRVVLPEFLLTGNEQNMDFLKTSKNASGTSNPGIKAIYAPDAVDSSDLRNDIRLAVIANWK